MTSSRISALMILCVFASAHCKRDKCSSLDLCSENKVEAFRTCSCEEDCYKYGICCEDAENFPLMTSRDPEYECFEQQTTTPVFVKKTCADEHKGRSENACMEASENFQLSNLLVSSSKTKRTYWNKDCAICNEEEKKDLLPWTVQLICPETYRSISNTSISISEKDLLDNLTYDRDKKLWGFKTSFDFVNCSINLYQPIKLSSKLNYCAPSMISSCPSDFKDADTVQRCSEFHAERKLKETYYKNMHCALCNGASFEELDCLGRNYAPTALKFSFNIRKFLFNKLRWTEVSGSNEYKCNYNFLDVFSGPKCEQMKFSVESDLLINNADQNIGTIFVSVIFVLISTLVF